MLNEAVDPELLSSMREGVPGTLAGVPGRQDQENDAIPKIAPKWLKHDRQVSDNVHFEWLADKYFPVESAIIASTFYSINYISHLNLFIRRAYVFAC